MWISMKLDLIEADLDLPDNYCMTYEREADLSIEPRVGELVAITADDKIKRKIRSLTHTFKGGITVHLDHIWVEHYPAEDVGRELRDFRMRLEDAGWMAVLATSGCPDLNCCRTPIRPRAKGAGSKCTGTPSRWSAVRSARKTGRHCSIWRRPVPADDRIFIHPG